MILSCPSCGTRFTLADAAFANGPRRLRCAKCQHVWRADSNGPLPEPAPEPPADDQLPAPALAEPPSSAPAMAGAPETAPPALPSEAAAVPEEPARFTTPPLPSAIFLQTVEQAANRMPRLPRRLAWAVVILLLLSMVATLYFGRTKLAARFPVLDDAYRSMGLIAATPVESFDLQLTQAEKCVISGRNMLCLSGTVTNRSDKPLAVPTIYITALDKDGREFTDAQGHAILSWTVPAESGKLLPRETRNFSLTQPYPDKTVTDFDYGFIDDQH